MLATSIHMLNDDLNTIGRKVNENLSAKHEAREKALPLARKSIRFCANAIRAIHRAEYDNARDLLVQSHECLQEIKTALADQPGLMNTGYVNDAQKEYAEGRITLALVTDAALPDPDELDIGYASYLNGMAEAASEMRRQLLDRIREGNFERAETQLAAMDEIYNLLITVDYPDALTGGLRRTTDQLRGVLEKSRGDLTMALNQSKLERKLERVKENFGA
ncbi:haloacid dehalogenase [Chloroflexota bacterium]